MSDRMTSIALPGQSGWAEYGRHDIDHMIRVYREHAARQLAKAQAVLDAADSDFRVETYVGPWARNNRVVLQDGRADQ